MTDKWLNGLLLNEKERASVLKQFATRNTFEALAKCGLRSGSNTVSDMQWLSQYRFVYLHPYGWDREHEACFVMRGM